METHSCPDEHFQTPDSKPPSTVDYSESLSGDLGTALESANFADESEVKWFFPYKKAEHI